MRSKTRFRKILADEQVRSINPINQLNMLLYEWEMNAEEGARLLGIPAPDTHEVFRSLAGRERPSTENEQQRKAIATDICYKLQSELSRQRKGANTRGWLAKQQYPGSSRTLWEMIQTGSLGDLLLVLGALSCLLSERKPA